MRNASLWSNLVFEKKKSNFPRIWFRDLRFRIWGLEIKHRKRTQLPVTRMFFLSLLSRNFDDQSSSNFHRFVISCICWDTPSLNLCLWQLPIVSTVFQGRKDRQTSGQQNIEKWAKHRYINDCVEQGLVNREKKKNKKENI